MYTYRCNNTNHVHVPLSQYETCTRTAVTIKNMYTYNWVLQILMPTFRILVFMDVSLFRRFEVFRHANRRNDSAVETSNYAAGTVVI